mgnify:CR=1 FL=1
MATDPNIAIEAGDTLDNLVDQFSDPFAFLRELVQNSIDAGSHRVDIEFEFTPHQEGNRGVFVLHVNDTGEGMTREIIDTKLTRLFSSAKEDDYTKIGKFGIGFVSIFARQRLPQQRVFGVGGAEDVEDIGGVFVVPKERFGAAAQVRIVGTHLGQPLIALAQGQFARTFE